MKKNKKNQEKSRLQQLRESPDFLKNINIYAILIFIFILSIIILAYRYVNNPVEKKEFVFQKVAPVVASNHIPASVTAPEPAPIGSILQNDRLTHLENRINELRLTLQISHQLVALEMLKAILEGHLPLKTLTLYLQKNPEPWTRDVLNMLSPIKEIKTYDQLQTLLVLQPQPLSLWKRIKNTIKSFVRIRKLDKEGNEKRGNFEDMRTALRAHDIQKTLEFFDKLSPQEQTQLVLWKQGTQDRLTLETIKQKILLQLSEG